jgi:hypothetical protein
MPRYSTLPERFWSKVNKDSGRYWNGTPCWEWTACIVGRYGGFCVERKILRAHRVAYELCVAPIPEGLKALHHCDNPICVNPAHLFLGTTSDNALDAVQKGRQIPPKKRGMGIRNGRGKLTDEQVAEIRRRYRPRHNGKALAAEYGVGLQCVVDIAVGRHRRQA